MPGKKAYIGKNLVDTYDAKHYGGPGGRHVFRKDIAIMERLCGDHPGLILDIPCGTGIYTAYFHQKGLRTVGVDISLPMLAKAQERRDGLELLASDIHRLPFDLNSIRTMFIIRLFQHLPKTEMIQALKELGRVVTPDGHILFDTLSWSPRKARQNSYEGVHVYSFREVEELIRLAGLKKVDSRSAYFFSAIWYRKFPVGLLKLLDRLEMICPGFLLLRTFWLCTK